MPRNHETHKFSYRQKRNRFIKQKPCIHVHHPLTYFRIQTVFAYGQSGAGKTHTMDAHSLAGPASNPAIVLDKKDPGITLRAVAFLFELIMVQQIEAQLFASFMEVVQPFARL